MKFRRLFQFRVENSPLKFMKMIIDEKKTIFDKNSFNGALQFFEPTPGWIYRSYPFIDWDNDQYQEFMVRLLRSLEIR